MKRDVFTADAPGQVILNLQRRESFLPDALPPQIVWDDNLLDVTHRATQAVAQLCGSGGRFPQPERLIRLFLRREAELSSRIEQTHASVRTMLLFEHTNEVREGNSEVREVQNNYQILRDGLAAIADRPITLGLIRELHKSLFADLDVPEANPGKLRSIPVFIGQTRDMSDARFVPPPPLQVESCMRDVETFIRGSKKLPAVVRAALVHYQFETIHPFNDGNGRIGRALIMLMLVNDGLLSVPLLNPSAGLERHRREYYDRLLDVSLRGEWRAWIHFFCECVVEEAAHSATLLEKLDQLRVSYRERVRSARASGLLPKLIDELFAEPAQTAASVAKLLKITLAGAYKVINRLVKLEVFREVTGRDRDRVYLATEIVDLFSIAPKKAARRSGSQPK